MRKGWDYKKLGEVCEIVMGQSPDGDSINETEGIEFHQGKTCFGDRFLTRSNLYTNKPAKFAEAYSVLLCVRAPVGFPNITERRICIGRGLCSLSCKTDLLNMFLYYSLLGKQAYFEKNSTGSTFKAISSKIISNTELPVPSLAEQQSIVSELDKINELISLKKAQLSDLDTLAQSIFYEMFGDPIENEKGWEVKTIDDICSSIVRGPFGSALKKEFFVKPDSTTYKVYEQKHAIQKDSNIGSYYIAEGKFKELSRFEVKACDIIMSCSGTIGELYRIPNKAEKGIINQALLKFTLNESIHHAYFLYLMEYVKKDFTVRGSGLQNIGSVKIIKNMSFGLPPLPLQQSFARKIEAIEQQKTQITATIKDLETMLASRMQYWFD